MGLSAPVPGGATPLLETRGLTVSAGGRCLVADLDLELWPGEALAVLGPNGVGKTLTLQTLAGLRAPAAGEVRVDGQLLAAWPRRTLARRLGLLPQGTEDPFPATVMEEALIGRHPHLGFWQWESPEDQEIARRALAEVDLAGLEARSLDTLSGGERRRLAVATLLVQDPGVWLVDEPTNHLDPQHRLAVMRLLAARAAQARAVVVTLHDVNLAAGWCSRCLLLFGDGSWQLGPASEVLSETAVSKLYHMDIRRVEFEGRALFLPL
ncbi:ABC transporter ATP-binding protein [Wenzhouxiangella sp. XN24]|uniref:ABC transporter ATP-binding protein n=1 Tax=Wenzhouxiangella sp. XN24 TaxID=2713569 RepID=UPI0013EA256A|nr:ABC transporter ATP-binding protein [Wenzhouxiangella sp. XN24]NGX15968.1 ABC transporter ATP-binding protein [Wenzhouxiangella sp. XN24]